jgi:hypothetical protein
MRKVLSNAEAMAILNKISYCEIREKRGLKNKKGL